MKKGLYILSLIAFLVVFAACEKCSKPVMTKDAFAISENNLTDSDSDFSGGQRGDSDEDDIDLDGGIGITDPDEDEDFDGIVDPDEDEDFDEDGK